MSLGPTEILLIILLVVLLFGASRLSSIGRGLGEGIRNFKDAIGGDTDPKPGSEAPKQIGAGETDETDQKPKR